MARVELTPEERELRRVEKMAEAAALLRQGVQQVMESQQYQELVAFRRRFHRYSFNNLLLIYLQRPQATRVAGVKQWNAVGRRVIKGEKGILIIRPMRQRIDLVDADTGEVRRGEGELRGFAQAYVFDIAQTEGKEVPANLPWEEVPEQLGAKELFARLEQVAVSQGLTVAFEHLEGGARGCYWPADKHIGIATTYKRRYAQAAKTLAHELAHHVATGLTQDYAQGELVAESAAYMVLVHFGLDSGPSSFTYLASWASDLLTFNTNLKRADATAQTIIDAVEQLAHVSSLPSSAPEPILAAA